MHGPNEKGDIAESEIAACAIRAGCIVSRPMTDHPPYDLIIEVGGRPLRVQCKWSALHNGVIQVRLRRCSFGPTTGYVRRGYSADEIDAIGVYCDDLDSCYLVPMADAAGSDWLSLRIEPTKNGQRASLHWASEYLLPGAVAQLAERVHGMHEAGGSNPPSSIPPEPTEITVGANPFRNHFGYYMERAAAGEEITVTRRGKPTVRLVAHQPELRPRTE